MGTHPTNLLCDAVVSIGLMDGPAKNTTGTKMAVHLRNVI